MLLKSYELTGVALDWAVQSAVFHHMGHSNVKPWVLESHDQGAVRTCYIDSWAYCGPLLDELKISVMHVDDDNPLPIEDGPWTAAVPDADWGYTGPTALIAISRCYVAHKLGDDVEIPDELFKE